MVKAHRSVSLKQRSLPRKAERQWYSHTQLYDITCVFPASCLMNMYDDSSVSPLPDDSEGVFNITI